MIENKRKSNTGFLIQGSILAVASLISRMIGLFYRVPMTEIIGDVGNDYYSCAFEIYNIFLLISSFSIPLAVSKLVSARVSKGQRQNAFKVVKGAFVFALISGSIAGLFVYFGAEYFTSTILKTPMSVFALKVLSPTLLIVAILGVLRGYFQGLGTMVPSAISQTIEQLINAIVSVAAAYYLFGYGKKVGMALGNSEKYAAAYGAAGGTLGTGMGALAGLLFLVFLFCIYRQANKRKRHRKEPVESYAQITKLLLLTIIPVLLSTTVYNISGILDQAIFKNIILQKGYSKDAQEVMWGVFSGKYKLLINVPISISSAMAASCVPSIAAAFSNKRMKDVREQIQAAMRFTTIIAFPCMVGMAVLASPIMQLLFHDDSALPAQLLVAGSVAIVFYSISTLSNGILQGINRMKTPVTNAVIALLLHLFFLVALLMFTDWNIFCVVYANAFFAFLMCILNANAVKKYSKYRMNLMNILLIPLFCSAVMGVVVFFCYKGIFALISSNAIATILSICVGGVVYAVGMLKCGMTEEDVLRLPKGAAIARLAKKLHLLKQ